MFRDDIFKEMMRMQREMDRMFHRAFEDSIPSIGYKDSGKEIMPAVGSDVFRFRSPKCDVCETETSIIATIELPGVDKKDIDLNVSDDMIEVKVEKKDEKEVKDKDSYQFSSNSASFYRNIPLPREVDSSKADAEYKNGMLRIEIPKRKSDKSKKLEIK